MKNNLLQKFVHYLYNNFLGNFLGFAIGMASTRLVSHFFATKSIKNLWGLSSHKTVLDKKTYSNLEWIVSLVIGFIVFEIISKWAKKKMDAHWPKFKASMVAWLEQKKLYPAMKKSPGLHSDSEL